MKIAANRRFAGFAGSAAGAQDCEFRSRTLGKNEAPGGERGALPLLPQTPLGARMQYAAARSVPGGGRGICSVLRLMGTAYHEAGHAVAAYAVWPQHPVELATIIPADGYLDQVLHGEQDGSWRTDAEDGRLATALAAESETATWLAGYLAEALFLDGIAETMYRFEWTPDSFGAQDAASGTWDGDGKPIHHLHAYWHRTRELLGQPEVWLAVARVAGTLLRCGELSGSEIKAMVIEAGVEPDRERVPLFSPSEDNEDEDDEAFSWERW